MKIQIPKEIKEQLQADGLKGLHVRDFISYDVDLNGNITPEMPTEFMPEYLKKLQNGLLAWFNSLTSDSAWYKYVDGDVINVHGEEITD